MILKKRPIKNKILTAFALLLSVSLAGTPLSAAAKVEDDAIYTEEGYEDYQAELSRNKAQTIETNQDPAWPQGPAVGAAGAVVMDAESGAVLYGKNKDKQLFPASITKLMTALLAYENLNPNDIVTFSENAVFGIESGSSNIGMDVGEAITVDEALYGLMVASANEVAIALGERVSGTEKDFVNLMNQRALELGCNNTHFVTPNGLHDSDHYSSAYDMALIGREIFKHPDLIEYMSQLNYHFEPSEKQPDDFWILNTNDFLTGEITCDDVVGGKTGYTDQARETLVTFAERDGKKLICVIMREEPPYQYFDTVDLLNYAFDNFKPINIAKEENRFTQTSADFLSSGPDIFGKGTSSYYINEDAMLMIPKSASFSDLTAVITPAPYKTVVQEGDNEQSGEESSDASRGNTAGTADPQDTSSNAEQVAAEPSLENGTVPLSSSSQENGDKIIGIIQYKFHDHDLGRANVLFRSSPDSSPAVSSAESGKDSPDTGSTAAAADLSSPDNTKFPTSVHGIKALFFGLIHTGAHGSVYLNILLLIPLILVVTFLLCILIFVYDYFAQRSTRRRKQKRRAQRANRADASKNASESNGNYDTAVSRRRTNATRGTGRGRYTNTDRRTTNTGRSSSANRSSRTTTARSTGSARDRYTDRNRRGSVNRNSQERSNRNRSSR